MPRKNKLPVEHVWTYFINYEETPSENIKRLVDQLSISHIKLFTKQALKQKKGHRFRLIKMTMAGTARYVDDKLLEIYKRFKIFLNDYIISLESIINKKYELSLAINMINEAILLNNENLELNDKVNEMRIYNEIKKENKMITLEEVIVQENIAQEMKNHLIVRAKYLRMLGGYLGILKERIDIDVLNKELVPKSADKTKEIKLLEIWEGLILENFLADCDEQELTKRRGVFFSVFNLRDRLYNSRHREMKKKISLGDFTMSMAQNLKVAYKRIPQKVSEK